MKQPIAPQQLHTTTGLTAAKNNTITGENMVFITAQCRIKTTSVKDQKSTDPSCGQWGKPWPKDTYMSGELSIRQCYITSSSNLCFSQPTEVLDEYLATLNVRWSTEAGMALNVLVVYFSTAYYRDL